MRVILEVFSGTEKGRKARLMADQSIVVGRTEWADFAVPTDPRISSRHFSLAADYENCRLVDLGSVNGTFVNGKRTAEAVLKDGDQVVAGDTHFVVRLNVPAGGSTVAEIPFIAPGLASADPGAVSAGLEIRVKIAHSGLHQAECATEQLPPQELLTRLEPQCATYLIVDFKRLEIPVPAELAEPAYLFDWLPDPARLASPVVVDLRAWPAGRKFLKSAWGKDALICLGSQLAPAELLKHLRSRAHARRDTVFGFCWPTVLSAVLLNCAPELVKHLFVGIDWMLTENPDDPGQWQCFSYIDLQAFFDRLGLPTNVASPAEK